MKRIVQSIITFVITATLVFLFATELTATWTASLPFFVSNTGENTTLSPTTVTANILFLSKTHDLQQKLNADLTKAGIIPETVSVSVDRVENASILILNVSQKDPKTVKNTLQTVKTTLQRESKFLHDSKMETLIRPIDRITYRRASEYPLLIIVGSLLAALLASFAVDSIFSAHKSRKRSSKPRYFTPAFNSQFNYPTRPEISQMNVLPTIGMNDLSKKEESTAVTVDKKDQTIVALDMNTKIETVPEILHDEASLKTPINTNANSIPEKTFIAKIEEKNTSSSPIHSSQTIQVEQQRYVAPSNLPTASGELPEYLKAMLHKTPSAQTENQLITAKNEKEDTLQKMKQPETTDTATQEPSEEALKERLNKLLRGEIE